MSKKRYPHNPFVGRWKVLSLYCNVHDQGWTLFKVYGRNSFIWEFTEVEKIRHPMRRPTYTGNFLELRRNCKPEETVFSYFPDKKRLFIDRWDYIRSSPVNISINELYRVERINKNDMWIYDLEDVSDEPQDYRFKMKIRRLADD